MNDSKTPDEWDKEFSEFDAKSDSMYENMLVSTPQMLSERIKRYAREAQKSRRSSQQPAPIEQGYVDTFLLMAAADFTGNRVRELKSQSGEWTLRIYEDLDNRDQGYIILEVSPNRAAEFNGKTATLDIGGQHIFLGQIENGEAEASILLSGLVVEQKFSLKIE